MKLRAHIYVSDDSDSRVLHCGRDGFGVDFACVPSGFTDGSWIESVDAGGWCRQCLRKWCRFCRKTIDAHANGKCLFTETYFEPMKEP